MESPGYIGNIGVKTINYKNYMSLINQQLCCTTMAILALYGF